jgi:hypothetical protein
MHLEAQAFVNRSMLFFAPVPEDYSALRHVLPVALTRIHLDLMVCRSPMPLVPQDLLLLQVAAWTFGSPTNS